MGRLVSVNVGSVRTIEHDGAPHGTGIWKQPVIGRVRARGVNLDGDEQADRAVHGGAEKAVYAYAVEDRRYWERELGRAVGPGGFGENLSTEGIDVTGAYLGERWEIGTAVFEVSQPRSPCWKLAVRLDEQGFIRRFRDAGRPGAYLRIVEEGEVGAGDEIRVVAPPEPGITIGEAARRA